MVKRSQRRRPATVAAVLLVFVGLLFGCTNPLSEQLRTMVYAENGAEIAIFPEFSTLVPDTVLRVEFSKSMDPATLSLGGDLAPYATVEWNHDQVEDRGRNAQAWIQPETAWPVGESLSITVACSDTEGYPTGPAERSFAVMDGTLHVSPDGDDEHPGTQSRPLASITAAQELCKEINTSWTSTEPLALIRVAAGTYNETEINHLGGTVLDGGWKTDWSEQNPALYPSTIRPDLSSVEPPDYNGNHAILRVASGARETGIRNLTVEIAGSPFDVIALSVEDSEPIIAGVTIIATGSPGVQGVSITGSASPLVEDCRVDISGCDDAKGIYLQSVSLDATVIRASTLTLTGNTTSWAIDTDVCEVVVRECDIHVTGSENVRGVFGYGSRITLWNNVITAEAGDGSEGGIYPVMGIFTRMVVQNNTIVFPRIGIYADARSNPIVENNLFIFQETDPGWASGYTYWASSADAHPNAFRNNRMSGSDRVYLYADQDGDMWYYPWDDLPNLEADLVAMGREASGNTATATDETLYFTPRWDFAGPVPAEIGEGGLNLSSEFSIDRSGNARPASGPWSVGAYEEQGA